MILHKCGEEEDEESDETLQKIDYFDYKIRTFEYEEIDAFTFVKEVVPLQYSRAHISTCISTFLRVRRRVIMQSVSPRWILDNAKWTWYSFPLLQGFCPTQSDN